MASKKGFISMATVPSYSVVQSSRALHIFSELSKEFQDMYLIMQHYEVNEVKLDNLIQVRPLIPIDGRFSLVKGMLYRLQLSLSAFWFAIRSHRDFAILRGYD